MHFGFCMKNAVTLTVARMREIMKCGYQYLQRIQAIQVLETLCKDKALKVPSM